MAPKNNDDRGDSSHKESTERHQLEVDNRYIRGTDKSAGDDRAQNRHTPERASDTVKPPPIDD
jgi:hypothetical protein